MKQAISLLNQIKEAQQNKITGKLKIDNSQNSAWTLYFYQGRLIWAAGGAFAYRAWKRNLLKYCPEIDEREIDLSRSKSFECESYNILATWHQKKIIASKQLICLIENQITDILFDIIFTENHNLLIYQVEQDCLNSCFEFDFKNILILLNAEVIYQQSYQIWLRWQQKDLQSWSPNLIPIIKKQAQLKSSLPAVIYANLIKLLDGKNTLRDLAHKMNKDVVELTYSLKSYIQKGIIEFIEATETQTLLSSSKKTVGSKSKPLIACIDDSLQILQIMEYILTSAGYQFVGIQDPIQAVPKLLSSHPDLIFLDIAMPTINGYELCSQIQKVSKLTDIPIVMLTGNNGIIDRVRAKIVGAENFLSKPIEEEKVLTIVKNLIAKNTLKPSSPASKQNFSVDSAIAIG